MKAIIRKDETAVSPVIATILMVAITVVLAAVLYVMVSGLLTGPGTSKPVLTFATPTLASGGANIQIASVSPAVAATNYKVNLQVAGVTGTAIAMGANATVAVGATNYWVTWTDIGGESTVNGGDTFRVTKSGGLPAATSFVFYLLWSDGSQVQSTSWQTP